MSMLSLGVAFWFCTAVLIVCFMIHILCQNHKLRTEKILSDERISRIFYNSVTRKYRQTKRKSMDPIDAFAAINSAKGSFEAFERIYTGTTLGEIIGTTSDGVTLDGMNDVLSQQEEILRQRLPSV